MKPSLNAIIKNGFISRQLLLVMVLELVIQKNTVVLRFFFLKLSSLPSPLLWLGFVLTGFC